MRKLTAVLLVTLATPASAWACTGTWPHLVVCQINAQRADHDLQPLRESGFLDREAVRYARRMVREHFFAHAAPDGWTLPDRVGGYPWLALGENLAYGPLAPTSAVAAWMASPGHRANILEPVFTRVGAGVAPGTPPGFPGVTFVVDFATT